MPEDTIYGSMHEIQNIIRSVRDEIVGGIYTTHVQWKGKIRGEVYFTLCGPQFFYSEVIEAIREQSKVGHRLQYWSTLDPLTKRATEVRITFFDVKFTN